MSSADDIRWERMRQMLAASATGAEIRPVASQRTLFGIKSSVEEQVERLVGALKAAGRRRSSSTSTVRCSTRCPTSCV